jgi:hypothetical protein
MKMKTQWNIASATKPHDPDKFMELVREACVNDKVGTVDAMCIVPGPGCRNYGLQITSEQDPRRWVESLCMVLQPGKYNEVTNDPALREGEFYYAAD